MLLKSTLKEHKETVTCFTFASIKNTHYMISSGWDRRLCLWNLESGSLIDVFRNSNSQEYAADGVVTDLAFSPERREFAYSSADKMVYIRKFSSRVEEMKLNVVLQGHKGEVLQVKWYTTDRNWVTASEDQTVRIWVAFFCLTL
jgi:WD40 repeat protein